ncbi:MAG: YegP family protein [Clostridia bacterium]|nr:YegP family protein [Clostridia bacterium]
MGKFVIRNTPTGVKFDLKASNGEPISTSEVYKSEKSCRAGIASVKKNAPIAEVEDTTEEGFAKVKHPKFQIYMDKSERYRFRLRATNGQIIASCGEPYNSKKACLNGIDSVKRNAPDAEIKKVED